MKPLAGCMLLALVGDDYEDLELWYPLLRAQEAGAKTVIAGQAPEHEYRGKHGYPCTSEAAIRDVRADDYDAILIPGGWMPDKLRRDDLLLSLVRRFDQQAKIIASICHGPWILISAGVCTGVRMTGSPGIKDDLKNAGAEFVDEPVVVDRHFITSRRPADLPVFAEAIVARMDKVGSQTVVATKSNRACGES